MNLKIENFLFKFWDRFWVFGVAKPAKAMGLTQYDSGKKSESTTVAPTAQKILTSTLKYCGVTVSASTKGAFPEIQDMYCPGSPSQFVQDSSTKTRTVLGKPVRLATLVARR